MELTKGILTLNSTRSLMRCNCTLINLLWIKEENHRTGGFTAWVYTQSVTYLITGCTNLVGDSKKAEGTLGTNKSLLRRPVDCGYLFVESLRKVWCRCWCKQGTDFWETFSSTQGRFVPWNNDSFLDKGKFLSMHTCYISFPHFFTFLCLHLHFLFPVFMWLTCISTWGIFSCCKEFKNYSYFCWDCEAV